MKSLIQTIFASLILLISLPAQAVNLSEILENSLFGNVYSIAILGDEPLVLDQDIVLDGKEMTITAANISIPSDITISSFGPDKLVAAAVNSSKPPKAARGASHNGRGHNSHGGHGTRGRQGGTGISGLPSGKVKIITANKPSGVGKININLFGQAGGNGQTGGDGGDGFPGQNAHNASSSMIKCRREPGDGGNGGNGGTGGDGGIGGIGGAGGLIIHSAALTGTVILGNMSGGEGGTGGARGTGGRGATGGSRGHREGYCRRSTSNGTPGQNGGNGNVGLKGATGEDGDVLVL